MSKFSQVTCICRHCASEYQVQQYRANKTKYCSSHCRAVDAPKRPVTRVSKICEACSSSYEVIRSRADKTRFCSAKCHADIILRSEDVERKRLDAKERSLAPGRLERQAAAKERKREADSRYYRENKDTINAAASIFYLENREAILKANKEWRLQNAEYLKEQRRNKRERDVDRARKLRRADYRRNKARYKANARRREIDKLKATPSWADLDAIMDMYLNCDDLSQASGVKHHVDHLFPLKGKDSCGLHVPWNLQIIPAKENLKKSNSMPPHTKAFAFVEIGREIRLHEKAD